MTVIHFVSTACYLIFQFISITSCTVYQASWKDIYLLKNEKKTLNCKHKIISSLKKRRLSRQILDPYLTIKITARLFSMCLTECMTNTPVHESF